MCVFVPSQVRTVCCCCQEWHCQKPPHTFSRDKSCLEAPQRLSTQSDISTAEGCCLLFCFNSSAGRLFDYWLSFHFREEDVLRQTDSLWLRVSQRWSHKIKSTNQPATTPRNQFIRIKWMQSCNESTFSCSLRCCWLYTNMCIWYFISKEQSRTALTSVLRKTLIWNVWFLDYLTFLSSAFSLFFYYICFSGRGASVASGFI